MIGNFKRRTGRHAAPFVGMALDGVLPEKLTGPHLAKRVLKFDVNRNIIIAASFESTMVFFFLNKARRFGSRLCFIYR
jgi:hypothetical protein